jgi:hypothetical protein
MSVRFQFFESLNNQPLHGDGIWKLLLLLASHAGFHARKSVLLEFSSEEVRCSSLAACSLSVGYQRYTPKAPDGLVVLLLYDNCLAEIARGDCEAICVRDLTLQRF